MAVDPGEICKNDNMVSINTIIEMDITGQVCSESIGPKQFSGTGGAFCFAYGALHSKGGRGIPSAQAATKKGVSKISSQLKPGAVVSIPRNYVDYVVTEYGIAHLRGRSVKERALQLISIAHLMSVTSSATTQRSSSRSSGPIRSQPILWIIPLQSLFPECMGAARSGHETPGISG